MEYVMHMAVYQSSPYHLVGMLSTYIFSDTSKVTYCHHHTAKAAILDVGRAILKGRRPLDSLIPTKFRIHEKITQTMFYI